MTTADVFLMGTSGKFDDPKRSMWREPIKAALIKHRITFFDPVVPEWNDAAMKREVDALRTAKIIVLAITADTAGIASLAESGWAALSAIYRKQAFGLYIDNMFVAEGFNPRLSQESSQLIEYLFGKGKEKSAIDLADASRRARQLVTNHAQAITDEFPALNLYRAHDLEDLTRWTVDAAKKLIKPPEKLPPTQPLRPKTP